MRFGACGSFDSATTLLAAGFELVELPVFALTGASDVSVLDVQVGEINGLAGKLETYNCFVPGTVKVVGPTVDWEAVRVYLTGALDRIAHLGGKLVVFGSGAARYIPEGYSRAAARVDTLKFLGIAGDLAALRGLAVVIEPLNTKECNWINSVEEAYGIAAELDHPAVRVLSDLYHVSLENESYEGMRRAGEYLQHVHIASPITRAAVSGKDISVLSAYFKVLKEIGYTGRIVLECNWKDMAGEAVDAHATMVEAWAIS